jgi:hypothetical protein
MMQWQKGDEIMPFKDGTGPSGQGPRTGRGLGNCAGQGGAGRGRSFGRGRGQGSNAIPTQDNSWIQNRLDELQAAIQKLTGRLDNPK